VSVAALNVSVQAQIIDLLIDRQRRHQVSYLYISQDMALVERFGQPWRSCA
jgi:ABC-type microcin C transport system duplicated ATPase subunit YejF